MSVFLSPGVFTREIDLSLYIPNLSTTAYGVVGLASKGPINVPTYITDPVSFSANFGDPAYPGTTGEKGEFQPAVYAALQYLHTGRQAWFVRVAEFDPADPDGTNTGSIYKAKYAKATLYENSTVPVQVGSVNTLVTLNSGNNVITFVVDGGPSVTYTFSLGSQTSIVKSIPDVVKLLNNNADFSAILKASVEVHGYLVISGKLGGLDHSLLISGNNMTDNPFGFTKDGSNAYTLNNEGAGNVNEKPFVIGSGVTFPVDVSTNDVLYLKVGPTTPGSAVTVTLTAGATASLQDVIDDLNADGTFNGQLVASAYAGQLKISIKATDSTDKFLSLETGSTDAGPVIFGGNPVSKNTQTAAGRTLTFQSTSQGTWGNNLSVKIDPVYASNGITQTSFNLTVYEKSFAVENYRNLVMTPSDSPAYPVNAINGVSSRITVANPDTSTDFPLNTGLNPNYALSGGTNGAPAENTIDASIFIGIATEDITTGLQLFANPERIDLNLISVPGVWDAAVINAEIDLCKGRGDCMCIIDPPPVTYNDGEAVPNAKTAANVVDWVNGAGNWSTDHAAFNSNYAAVYWPWLQVYDPINATTVWTAPSGHIANVYAYTDLVSDPWIAPAGLTRGRLTTPLRAQYVPTSGERDLLYLSNINPIATFITDGINVFGQKTLQRTTTALDRVNVRRMLLYLEKVITTAARSILFEPDDQVTWLSFVNLVEPFMASVKSRRGLTDFQVRCDATTNPPDAIDRSEMHALIFIKPTKAAEFIQIDFVLTAQNANFNELVF